MQKHKPLQFSEVYIGMKVAWTHPEKWYSDWFHQGDVHIVTGTSVNGRYIHINNCIIEWCPTHFYALSKRNLILDYYDKV